MRVPIAQNWLCSQEITREKSAYFGAGREAAFILAMDQGFGLNTAVSLPSLKGWSTKVEPSEQGLSRRGSSGSESEKSQGLKERRLKDHRELSDLGIACNSYSRAKVLDDPHTRIHSALTRDVQRYIVTITSTLCFQYKTTRCKVCGNDRCQTHSWIHHMISHPCGYP